MDRTQRKTGRQSQTVVRLNESARILDTAMRRAGIAPADREEFLLWAVEEMWSQFKDQRMNRRILIENEINRLGLQLPNGTVNKDYKAILPLPTDMISGIEPEGPDIPGLSFGMDEDGKYVLSGIPSESGDFSLKLRYRTVAGEPHSVLTLPVAFNPDPRSLWKEIPSDPDIPYYKNDDDKGYVTVPPTDDGGKRKDMVAASRRGRSHAQEGEPRDDHFTLFHCDESDWYIMAVADGAGSAKYSRKGAEVACNTVVRHCSELLIHNPGFEKALREYESDRDNRDKRSEMTRQVMDIVLKGAFKAHEAIRKTAAANEGSSMRDFATTLMVAVCKKFDFGWFIASFWVGDGAMCIYDAGSGTAKLLGTPDEGEFSGQTRFLTMPEIFRDPDVVAKRLRMAIVPDFTALFLMSDGVSDPMFETDRNLNDYSRWEEFYRRLAVGFPEDGIGGVDLSDDNAEAAQDQLLRWLDFWSPGNHDDRTIAILY